MKTLIRCFFVASLLAMASIAVASSDIAMDPTADVVDPGEILTLRGNQRFNQGQLRNLYFFVGVELVSPIVLNSSTVQLTVPNLPPGLYQVRVVKHESHSGRDIVRFSEGIEVGGERVLSTTTNTISAGGGRLELSGVARVELTEDTARAPVDVTIEHVLSSEETVPFLAYLDSEGIPATASDTFIRILATERVNGFIGLRIRVPDEVRAALGAGLEPELYAEIPNISAHEDMGEYTPLRADYNVNTGELTAPFSGHYLHDIEGAPKASSVGTAQEPGQPRFSGRIRVSVRQFGTRQALVAAEVSFPDASTIEAGARETLNLDAFINIQVPIALLNPTDHGGLRSPEVTSGFSSNHRALDIRSRDNDPVYAAADGIVERIWNNVLKGSPRCNPAAKRGGGWSIAINHADGTRTSYSHLIVGSEVVSEGQSVAARQKIALADHTGGTCPSGPDGAHLHFGYRFEGISVDPLPFIQAEPSTFERVWLEQLSVIAVVDGTAIEQTRMPVTSKEFKYDASLELSRLDLKPNRAYPISLRLVTQDGQTIEFFKGTLKIKSTALRVILTWDKARTDVDLRVTDSNGRRAWFQDLNGIPGGFLDHDDRDGFGPEVFTLEKLQPNTTYTVEVHYFSDRGQGPTNTRTVVYLDNEEVTNVVIPMRDNQLSTIGVYPDAPQSAEYVK